MEYYVSKKGNDMNPGSKEQPFLTILKAASVAKERDSVIVCEGEYRECVIVADGAESDRNRIIFRAAPGEKVVIKGSEKIEKWEKYSGNIYKAVVSNDIFNDYNPYTDALSGDWFYKTEKVLHTGQVYADGISLREVCSVDEIKENNWFSKVTDTHTEFYADFNGLNPNEHLVEINVRKACFAAKGAGVNYITVSGFEMCHAATQWSPPTSEQTGLICVNWCKGWIIENNHIHDSRCNGICIGKDRSTGHNDFSNYHKMPAHFCQLEVVFSGIQKGWSKELVGSHIIRNNTIYNCGQTGIVGHMGCAFSEICGNHIYNIQNIGEFNGDEIAGIKFHAPVDTYIHHNIIHDCYRGMWLDWQVQGVRVSSNVLFNNAPSADIYTEVTHGPFLVDNNVLLSAWSVGTYAQGSAFVHNLFAGIMMKKEQERHTPYHYPHSTAVKGVIKAYTGDDRFYNNIFVGGSKELKENEVYGTSIYSGHPETMEEYTEIIANYKGIKLPAYINNNVYLAGAKPYDKEKSNVVSDFVPQINIAREDGSFSLDIDVPDDVLGIDTYQINTDNLPITVITQSSFENADGSKLAIDRDCLGNNRGDCPVAGPFEQLKECKKFLFKIK